MKSIVTVVHQEDPTSCDYSVLLPGSFFLFCTTLYLKNSSGSATAVNGGQLSYFSSCTKVTLVHVNINCRRG